MIKRTNRILILLSFLFTIPLVYYFANPRYYIVTSRSENTVISDLKNQSAPLTVPQTTELISQLYNELGPRIGSHLVEPNALLTLAGLRGRGNFLMHDLTQEEKGGFEQVNKQLKDLGITFDVIDVVQDEIADIYIINLKGLEYATSLSKFPFIKGFNASTGSKGYEEWLKDVSQGAKNYFNKAEPNISSSDNPLAHFLIGLQFGYPDQALLDMYTSFSMENRRENWPFIASQIPYSNYYNNPQPNFDFFPEDENEQSIVRIIKTWGNFLENFYNSPWQKKLEKDPEFIQMRKSEEELHDKWFIRRRLNQ